MVGPGAFKTLKKLLFQFVKEHETISLVLMEFTNTSNASLIQSGCLFPISLSFLYFITYKEMFSLLLCLAKCALVFRSVQVFLVYGTDICETYLAKRHLIIKENKTLGQDMTQKQVCHYQGKLLLQTTVTNQILQATGTPQEESTKASNAQATCNTKLTLAP